MPKTIISGPLCEFHLTDHRRFDPTATLHFGGGISLGPSDCGPAVGRLKKGHSASLVAGIGCNLVSVPERENEEGYETGRECGTDLQNDESCAKESHHPTWPAFRLLVRRKNSERSCNEQPGKRCPLA